MRYLSLLSSIANIARLINDTSGRLDQFIELYRSSTEVRDLISSLSMSEIPVPNSSLIKGDNIIYYGAPGTGKSHAIDDKVDEVSTVRTVFHSDTQNSDFMGCLKPVMDGDSIKYEFRPGPFSIAVINAINDPDNHHWLVIEEINRAAGQLCLVRYFSFSIEIRLLEKVVIALLYPIWICRHI